MRPRGRPRKPFKICSRCPETRRSEFGVDVHQPDGLRGTCKRCVRARAVINRKLVQERTAISRKPCRVSRPASAGLVMRAIDDGAKTQEEIRRATRLHEDAIADALADLWDAQKLDRQALRRREYIAA